MLCWRIAATDFVQDVEAQFGGTGASNPNQDMAEIGFIPSWTPIWRPFSWEMHHQARFSDNSRRGNRLAFIHKYFSLFIQLSQTLEMLSKV